MFRKLAPAFAAIAIALSASTLAVPTASAAPSASAAQAADPAPTSPAFGSVAFCFNIPLGVGFSFSICI
ncbi:hypothetical protein [Nocardia nepalensis]|uniref:hypothetical protein n=1 Tax=Nocardia nepalensis TaxID=3375448 RepID=UPI003B6703F8